MNKVECSCCRRANTLLCDVCQNANLLLLNDAREFYYINCEGELHKGPVKAYLLPYYDVWPDSYVWAKGMKQWDFAGNVLDRRVLAVSYSYCPCCNGMIEKIDVYPDDRETIYRCKKCGFEFSYGATRMCSEAQREYSMLYIKHLTNK